MMYAFPGALTNQRITLTFDPAEFKKPDSVLVFPFYQGKLLFTRNKKRGWEIPGGKREQGEWPIHAALRELYEETGAEAEAVDLIGQYRIETPRLTPIVKSIYIARVAFLHPLPKGFETDQLRLFEEPPEFKDICADAGFSRIVKDQVYPLALERVRTHDFAARPGDG